MLDGSSDYDHLELGVKLLLPTARAPERATVGSAGYDLAAAEAVTVPARGQALARTGLSLCLPPGCYGRIAPRSGLAVRHGLHVGAGVVDSDYTGEVKVVLFNLGPSDVTFAVGDRVAQLILERILTVPVSVLPSEGSSGSGSGSDVSHCGDSGFHPPGGAVLPGGCD